MKIRPVLRTTTFTATALAAVLVATALGVRDGGGRSAGGGPPGGGPTEVTVIIENLAPDGGTALTPFWVAFHDGSFDSYDHGAAISPALERLAEDGTTGPVAMAFLDSGAGGTEATLVSDTGIPPLLPGETATMTFMLDGDDPGNRFFSYAAMVLPSNDAFIANGDPRAVRVFRNNGRFVGAEFIVLGADVNDAGSELNDENPMNTAFFGQMTPDTGLVEGVGVHDHVGFKFPGNGGILDDPAFMDGDFLAPGYAIARIMVFAEGGGADDDDDGHGDDDDDGGGDDDDDGR